MCAGFAKITIIVSTFVVLFFLFFFFSSLGEIAVATACKAQLVVHVEWQSSNVLVTGTLICTNYRLQFVPNPTSLEKVPSP